jgi:hypothetical protein
VRRPRGKDDRGHDRKRRKLAGEDDTDMDIRLAKSAAAPKDEETDTKVLKLRSTASDAPLTDHAGNIDLFPVDMKEAMKREKNMEAEKEKRNKQKALEDQYTMRFSNAGGRGGIEQPWYTAQEKPSQEALKHDDLTVYDGYVNKNVWGNEDPRRKEREQARISTNDPFAFMQKAQAQLKKSKQDKKQWAEERERELRELRATQDLEDRRDRHHKRKKRDRHEDEGRGHDVEAGRSSRNKDRHRSRSRSRDRHRHRSSHRSERRHSRTRSSERDRARRKSHYYRRDEGTRHSREESRSAASISGRIPP